MKWKDGNGQLWDISREQARKINQDQGRKHMPRPVVESIIAMGAAKAVLKAHRDQVQKWAKETKAWSALAPVVSLLGKAIDIMVSKALVEQVCAIQHNTENVWVNVTAHQGTEKLNIDQADLAMLMHAARGGIKNSDGQSLSCYNCPYWSNRAEWQKCDLYDMINRIPCDCQELPQLMEDVCPYCLSTGEDMEL